MTKPHSTKYRFETVLSENELAQSWIALDLKTDKNCFVKIPLGNGSLTQSDINAILAHSFNLQKKIKCSKIITATEKYLEYGNLLVAYPYLDDKIWQSLTADLFWRQFDQAILQMAVIVDYLHLLDIVHCDLKLSNFLINIRGTTPKLILIDLDFLSVVDASPRGKLFGSPDHIAPEILANERIYTQSDNYSIGVTFGRLAEYYRKHSTEFNPGMATVAEQLDALSKALIHQDPWHRPRVLVDALLEHKLIDRPTFESAQKTVLAMRLLGEYRLRKTGQGSYKPGLVTDLLGNSQVLGLSDEWLGDLEKAAGKSMPAAFRVFKEITGKSAVERYGDYWRILMSDDILSHSYLLLENIIRDDGSPGLSRRGEFDLSSVDQLQRRADDYRKTGQAEKALLTYQTVFKLVDGPDEGPNTVLDDVLKSLAQLAAQLHRNHDAYEYYNRLLARQRRTDSIDAETMEGFTDAASRLRLLKESQKYTEEFIGLAVRAGDLRLELELRISDAWNKAAMGSNSEAEEIIRSIISNLSDKELPAVWTRAYYMYGVILWRRGDFTAAEKHYLRSLGLADQNRFVSQSMRAVMGLVLLYLDTAEYEKASKFFKVAIKNLQSKEDYYHLPLIANCMSTVYSRMGEYRKSEYWLQRSHSFTSIDSNYMLNYYVAAGLTSCASGDFISARAMFEKGLEVFTASNLPARCVLKTHYNMAELAVYQGQPKSCDWHLSRAVEISDQTANPAFTAELKLFGLLNDFYNKNGCATEALLIQIGALVKHNCRYLAAVCLFHTLVSGEPRFHEQALDVARPLQNTIGTGDSPLFRALGIIAEGIQSGAETPLNIVSLKGAYRILEGAGQKFAALILCRKIAESYIGEGKTKLARKFFSQALKIAESIDNKRMVAEISERLAGLADSSTDHSSIMESVRGISEIFKNLTDYEKSLIELVRFAVDNTGAERGVLLLKGEQSSDLRVKAFVNCDEDSLKDIKDFSSSIPLEVARDLQPLIIDNALADKRTKNYKSIIAHNILSVICLPIEINQKLLGVLYLDHHTIPALFERNDIVYVSSIANLLSVMLVTIQNYRDVNVINRQLVEDVNRVGGKSSFITRDRSMLQLFDKLPEIARTNASVLVLGESGTGKEILCEMIHNLSLRSRKPLVKLNCAAIAGTLIESELFGVAKHVATDVKEREGKFAAADGGTLLLDEIGDMPLEIQAKVLRAVEYQQFERVGSNKPTYTDIRFICATNKDLLKFIKDGKFREDLYHRINTIVIEISPLRERRGDIILLIEHFLRLYSYHGKPPTFSSDALTALLAYRWPGNVRELKNVVERCYILWGGRQIDVTMLPSQIQSREDEMSHDPDVALQIEKERIRATLLKNNWNQSKTAQELTIPLTTLRRKIKKYRILRSS